MPIGLYLHIPFCLQKCAYCDFASFPNRQDAWQPVMDAMIAEMARYGPQDVATVFIGGGTPTLLPAEMIASLLSAARNVYTIAPDAEITVEANPGTLDAHKLGTLMDAGINRLSLGAQAMQPEILQAINRIHRWADVQSSVRLAHDLGLHNINLDLMYGLPGQTPAMFRDTLLTAIDLDPTHLSIYSLILEEGTPLFSTYADNPRGLPGEEASETMSDDALWITGDAGIHRYEISNYARDGYACRHNLGYWLRRDYLGIGCAAHSLMDNHRWGNADTIEGYLAGEHSESITLTEHEALFERLLLGLRLVEGIPWESQALYDTFRTPLERLRERGLVDWDATHIWPTSRGLDLNNRIGVELMD